MRDFAFLGLFLAALAIAFNRVYVCVLLWAWIALLGPNTLFWGVASDVPFNKVIAGLTLLAFLMNRDRKKFHFDQTSVLISCFLGLAAISQYISESNVDIGWNVLDKLWKIVLLNLLISSFMRSRVRLHALVLAVCIAAGFSAAGDGLKFLVSGGSYRTLGTPNWGDNNHVALIVLMVIPMLAYVREVSTERLVRLGALAGIALFVCGVVSTTSRGGFLGLLLLAGAGIVGSRHKIRYLLAVVALGAMLSQVVTENWTERMNSLEEVREDTSFMGRVIAWKISILIALDNPLVGGGLHAVQAGNIWNAYRVGFGQSVVHSHRGSRRIPACRAQHLFRGARRYRVPRPCPVPGDHRQQRLERDAREGAGARPPGATVGRPPGRPAATEPADLCRGRRRAQRQL